MPVNCDPSSLANAARCFASCIPPGEFEAVKVYLICEYANKSTGPATPGSLDVSDPSVAGNTILTWTNSDLPTTNEIWKSTDGVTFAFLSSVSGSVHTFTDTAAMANNVFFYYKVRATTGGVSSTFSNTVSVSNNVDLTASVAVAFSFPTLILAYGFFDFHGAPNVTSADFRLLRKAGALTGYSTLLASINVDSLVTVPGSFYLFSTRIVTLSLPKFTTGGASVSADACNFLTSVSLPVLTTSTGDLSFANCPLMTTLSLPLLTTCGGTLFAFSSGYTSVSAPLLASVGTDVQIHDNAALTSVNLSQLQTVGGNMDFSNSTSLTTLNLPKLVTSVGLTAFNSTVLTTVSLPLFLPPDVPSLIAFDACVLVVGSSAAGTGVDGVLRRCALAGLTQMDIELNTPGNAPPSASGQADKATLIGNGCIVVTN